MKPSYLLSALFCSSVLHVLAAVTIDDEAFGKSLGGWKKQAKTAAEYPLSGSDYRTYKPEISPTPDAGIFISVRIDHMRGWLASDDHAILEITVSNKGVIVSAQSTIAIQGQSIKSDVILGSNEAGKSLLSPAGAVQIGTDLVADLSAKLLRENVAEAGRVSFPAVLRHNYNRLFQAIRVDGEAVQATTVAAPFAAPVVLSPPTVVTPPPATPPPAVPPPAVPAPAVTPPPTTPLVPTPASPLTPVEPKKPMHTKGLEIKPYG